jgi:hypothetical protein
MPKPELKSPRLPYSPPLLTVYGTLQRLTQANLTSGHADGKPPTRFGIPKTAI